MIVECEYFILSNRQSCYGIETIIFSTKLEIVVYYHADGNGNALSPLILFGVIHHTSLKDKKITTLYFMLYVLLYLSVLVVSIINPSHPGLRTVFDFK
jgi:hypothetical protein